jgi:hypothetical protein
MSPEIGVCTVCHKQVKPGEQFYMVKGQIQHSPVHRCERVKELVSK